MLRPHLVLSDKARVDRCSENKLLLCCWLPRWQISPAPRYTVWSYMVTWKPPAPSWKETHRTGPQNKNVLGGAFFFSWQPRVATSVLLLKTRYWPGIKNVTAKMWSFIYTLYALKICIVSHFFFRQTKPKLYPHHGRSVWAEIALLSFIFSETCPTWVSAHTGTSFASQAAAQVWHINISWCFDYTYEKPLILTLSVRMSGKWAFVWTAARSQCL